MINLKLSVRDAMNLATNCNAELYERIVNAFEVALGVNQSRTVTITKGMRFDNRISVYWLGIEGEQGLGG